MKFDISRSDFLNQLQKIQSIIPTHTPQALFHNVLLASEKNKLYLTATDGYITMKCAASADVKKKGATTIPARRLFSVVRELPEQQVHVDLEENEFTRIECGASSTKMHGLSAEDFPSLPVFSKAAEYNVDAEAFREMLKKTVYAVSCEESRPILNGVLLKFKDQKMSVVATDGRRLAVIEQELEVAKESENAVVLPTKAASELIRCLDGEGKLRIEIESRRVSFETEDMRLVATVLVGEYPNYEQVIPSRFEERITVEREGFLAAMRRVSLLTSENFPSIKTVFSDNSIMISAVTPDVGEAHETVPVKYGGKEITVAFNPEFLMDCLRNLTGDEVFLEIVDDTSPMVVKCDIPFLYVLMPLHLNS